ncbi:MAG: hypothetical protein JNK82_29110 [Myxococcaceae bacterium]|nr:hypothetical protein [Myxococcaceae bacterium]
MTMMPAMSQTPAQKRALGLKQLFEAALKSPKLGTVKGNLLVFVPNVATWTLVTTGPRPGLRDLATDDEIHFAICCDDFLLTQLMTGVEVDFEQCIAQGRIKLEGDVGVFVRYIGCIPDAAAHHS